jgi:protein-S-isoprenylcysteine O-methyltransferase Ste14
VSEPLVFESSGASAVFVATIVGSAVVEWIVTYRERRVTDVERAGSLGGRARVAAETLVESTTTATRADKGEDRGTKRILVGSMLMALLVGVLIAQHVPALALPGNAWVWLLLGAAVASLGIGVRAWAITTLGRFFRRDVTISPEQRVIATGPYRFVRHPAYFGNLVVVAGVGLMLGNALALVVMVVVVFLGHIPRIRVEEAALERELGEPYRRFEAGRARLVPGVW